jgi:hypothetical protein
MAISLDFGRIFYGKPAPTPHQVRGLLFRKMLCRIFVAFLGLLTRRIVLPLFFVPH